MSIVAGLDGWKGGWVAVILDAGRFHEAFVSPSLDGALPRLTSAEVIGIDMPIGFPSRGTRRADHEARSFVGPRHNSVFLVPPRHVINCPTYASARRAARASWDRGLTAQTYALRDKMLEIDGMARHDSRFVEVHPEVSFRALSRRPLQYPKRTWNGERQRMALLKSAGIVIPDEVPEVPRVPADDLLDAAVVAWSANRHVGRRSNHLPRDADPANEPVIWY
jgi:predicted RNase H-like nuclease